MRVRIYQVDFSLDQHHVAFLDRRAFEKWYGERIPAEIYKKVFDGELEVCDPEQVFVMFNVDHPEGYTGRSLSVSDVVEFVGEGVSYFCDILGFKKVRFAHEAGKEENSGALEQRHTDLGAEDP